MLTSTSLWKPFNKSVCLFIVVIKIKIEWYKNLKCTKNKAFSEFLKSILKLWIVWIIQINLPAEVIFIMITSLWTFLNSTNYLKTLENPNFFFIFNSQWNGKTNDDQQKLVISVDRLEQWQLCGTSKI